jgi:hypothetical protein
MRILLILSLLLVPMAASATPPPAASTTWSQVQPQLRVRVQDMRAVEDPKALGQTVHKVLADGLWAVLVLDSESESRSITAAELKAWGTSEQAAFVVAGENHREIPSTTLPLEPPESALATRVVMGGFYVTSELAWLGRHLEDAPGGWFVVAPGRDALWAMRIDGPQDAQHGIATLPTIVAGMRAEEATPFSSGIFWWHEGRLERLSWALQGAVMVFQPGERWKATERRLQPRPLLPG